MLVSLFFEVVFILKSSRFIVFFSYGQSTHSANISSEMLLLLVRFFVYVKLRSLTVFVISFGWGVHAVACRYAI